MRVIKKRIANIVSLKYTIKYVIKYTNKGFIGNNDRRKMRTYPMLIMK